MQDSDVVGGGNALRQFRHHPQSRGQRDGGESALALGPFGQVGPAEFAFQVEGGLVKIPFQEPHKVGPLAERVFEQPGQGHLAFETLEPDAVGGEFEDARLMGLGMFGQPDLARVGCVQSADQPPLVAPGHGLSGLEPEFAKWRRRHLPGLNRHGHAIADARDGEDDRGLVLPQGFAQLGNGGGQRAFHHGDTRPGGFEQFLLGHHLAGAEEQLKQHFEGLGFQFHHDAAGTQFAAGFIEFEIRKPPYTSRNLPLPPAIRIESHGLNDL